MKLLKVLCLLVVLLALVGVVLPSATHVERTVVINAPQELVFDYVNDFQKFNEWSPWAKRDPSTRYEYSGPAQGVGSKMVWNSEHEEVGKGSQVITLSKPHSYVQVFLDFGDQGQCDASYTLTSINGATQLIWAFEMEHGWNLISRFFGLMMDGMIGPDYESGLTSLKQMAESAAATQ